MTSQPTPQTYRALAASLLKRKKARDFLRVICDAYNREITEQAIIPQLQAAAGDDSMAEAMLDAGLLGLSERPPTLPQTAFQVLSLIANSSRSAANSNRRLEKLLKIYQLQLDQAPNMLVYAEIADTERRLGLFDKAATTVEQMIGKYPAQKSVRTLAFLAEYQYRAGHKEEAKATLAEAMKLNPTDVESQFKLANVLGDVGQVDDAIRVIRDLSKKEPDNSDLELLLSDTVTKFGRNDEAIKVLEGMVKRYGDNDEVLKDIRSRLSVIYVNMGNYAKGEAELDSPPAQSRRARAQQRPGLPLRRAGQEPREGRVDGAQGAQEDPENYAYLDSMGWVLFKQGKVKEALATLMKAAERMKITMEQLGRVQDPTIFEHLGDVYFQIHEVEKAEDSWRQALRPPNPPSRQISEWARSRRSSTPLESSGP